ncbi:hypothetical protein GCM10007207_02240 [Asaia siamensis]|uniref:Uncharacterized protein n=1 Tax=Asaia siamensis TaxID=110479 RepID=A0ABQ1LD44_9PROT|nr:hypothetical protein AA0323_2405 [Asaia siamensis NRIC 0323]GGC20531.1 hypothetical protein GCM10007207_02240 [Asaia siamensis]
MSALGGGPACLVSNGINQKADIYLHGGLSGSRSFRKIHEQRSIPPSADKNGWKAVIRCSPESEPNCLNKETFNPGAD